MTRDSNAARPAPTALPGLTVLVVDDSRVAADALRLMLRAFGARMRRAESLAQARRHLALYRPDAVILDLDLPDGTGETLIPELLRGAARPRVVVLSGHPERSAGALAAGADLFLDKPVAGVAALHGALCGPHASGDWCGGGSLPAPDPMALRDDLAHAERVLGANRRSAAMQAYAARFLRGVARSTGDTHLCAAAEAALRAGDPSVLRSSLRARIAAQPPI